MVADISDEQYREMGWYRLENGFGLWFAGFDRTGPRGYQQTCRLTVTELESGVDEHGLYRITVKLGEGEFGRAECTVTFAEEELVEMLRTVHSEKALRADREQKLEQRRERAAAKRAVKS